MSTPPARRSPLETTLVASVGLLCALGLVMVQSASSVHSVREFGSPWTVVGRHATYLLIGVVLAVVASRLPLQFWKDRATIVLVVVSIGCLVLVQIPGLPFTPEVNGATRWIRVGSMGFQPSDLAKLALVLWLARSLTVHRDLVGSPALLQRTLALFGPLAALVVMGDDLGTMLLLGFVFLAMLYLAGLPLRQLGLLSLAGAAVTALLIMVLDGFRLRRILAFLRPDAYLDEEGYQVLQSRIGFASGGLWGQGPGSSRGKWGFLPEAHTDFILSVIGEELGVLGTVVVIAALAAVVASAFLIGIRCGDRFGRLVAWGIAVWFAVQALINLGVSVGALPTKGIPLPFVSYGGTAMVVSLLAVGVLFAVSRSDREASGGSAERGAARRQRSAPARGLVGSRARR